MKKINFQNGSEGKTPLNKTNMNLIQTNVEDEFNKLINALSNNKETVTGENITVNDSAEERVYEFNISGNSKQNGEPTPDTPIEVKSCGDNVNLFDKDNPKQYIKNTYIDGAGSCSTAYTQGYYSVVLSCKPNTTYTISKILTTTFRVGDLPNAPQATAQHVNNYKHVPELTNVTITTSANAKYLIIAYYNVDLPQSEEEIRNSIKVEEGSIVTPYTPYGQGCINEVICNKNLFKQCNGIWYGGNSYISNSTTYGFSAKVKPNTTYTISKKNQGNRFIITAGAEVVEAGNSLTRIVFASNHTITKYTFTTQENEYYVFLGVYNGIGTSEIALAVEEVLIEEGSTSTEYEEHKEQTFIIPTQPLKSIGDVRDTFVKVNGKWFERHNTDRVIFNGTESWQNVQGYGIFYINDINNLKPNTSAETLMGCVSNCFKEITTAEINAKKEGFCVATTNRLYFFHNGFSPNENIEGFKAWLQTQYNAGTPVYVDYILATPKDIECTSEQVAKLNELNSTAKTYKGTTHFYSTDNVGANKEVRYFKDIEIMMNN